MIKNGIYKYAKEDGTDQLFLFIDKTSIGYWSVYEYTGAQLDKTVLKTYNHNRIDSIVESLQLVTTLAADKEGISMTRIVKGLFGCDRSKCLEYIVSFAGLIIAFIIVSWMSEQPLIKIDAFGNAFAFGLTAGFFMFAAFMYRWINEHFYSWIKYYLENEDFVHVRLEIILTRVGNTYFDIAKKKTL